MPFDINIWKEQLNLKLPGWRARMQADGVKSAYYFIAASTFLPIAQAFQTGNVEPLLFASVASGIGANLLANIIQNWRDTASAVTILQEASIQDTELPKKLDALLNQLAAIPLAEQHLFTEDRNWFANTIKQELTDLKSEVHYEAKVIRNGAIAQGNDAVALAPGATYVRGNYSITNSPDPREIQKEQDELARRAYLEKLSRHCQVLPLAALGGEEGTEEELSLDDVYIHIDTTINIKTNDLADLRAGKTKKIIESELKETYDRVARLPDHKVVDKVEALPVLDAVRVTPRVVLLGDPGAGKSTFARKLLGLQAAALLDKCPPLSGFSADLLPVMVILRELVVHLSGLKLNMLSAENQKQKLLEVVHTYLAEDLRHTNALPFVPLMRQALESGKVLLVLDGLDEVPQDLRKTIRQVVACLLLEYHIERLIITSRIRSYTGSAVFENIPTFTLRPFDEEKIGGFVNAWYRAQTQMGRIREKERPARVTDLQQAATSAHLIEIASNPMMLTSMAIIHQKEIGLPKERVRLYKLVVDVLLRRWQKYKLGEGQMAPSSALVAFLIDGDRLLNTLERLAYEAHCAGQGEKHTADLPRMQALEILEQNEYLGEIGLAHEFLDYVDQRTGLLKGNGGDLEKPTSYSLPHRIFQEYLAGCYLVRDRSAAREYYRHAAEGDFWTLAAQLGAEELYYNRRGRHTMRDLAYDLLPGEHPTSPAEQRASLWSGLIATIAGKEEIEGDENSPKGGPKYLKLVRPALLKVLQGDLSPIERAEAGRVLAKLGDPRPEVMTCEHMRFCHIPAGPFLYGDEKKKINLPSEFWMGTYPVTNAQFRQFVAAGGYAEARFWQEAIKEKYWEAGKIKGNYDEDIRSEPVDFGETYTLSNHPVVGVTWYEAQAFIRWLSEQLPVFGAEWVVENGTGETAFRQHLASQQLTVLLPGEEHWEKAARGTDGRVYPWGEDADPNRANYRETGINTTNAVGCFPDGKSPYGLLEMSGNVWEWTSTLEGLACVLLGGSFGNLADLARCACRGRLNPYLRSADLGFRVMVVSPGLLSHA